MAYSSDIAKLVTDQLARFVTLNRHQLAGQVANLDFWIEQVRHALAAIDGYDRRFEQMKTGQERYVAEHGTTEFTLGVNYPTSTTPSPPRRLPDNELRQARRSLCNTVYRFLVRCCNEQFIDTSRLQSVCTELGIDIEAADLREKV